ncbi:hypothetical protein F2Q69_00024291 [Brassica cretica]|uniref:Uncharacterized protein n=1 Tax=Brassica cretica TaxID=69181 RepID=A0A8S9QIL0_BRACR|nr:hypothetical protein F2Q69_00024291 [Brassica cretica]
MSVGDRLAQRRHCTPKYVGRLFIDRVGIIDGLNPQHITDAMKNMFGMTLDYTTSYRALLYAQTLMMRQLHAVSKNNFLGGEGSTHAELLAMAQEDYNLDMSTKSVDITYSLPAEMMQAPDAPPNHVTNENDENYSVYGKVEDENEEDDDMCFEDIKKIEGGRSNGNNIYNIQVNENSPCDNMSVGDRLAQRRHCTPKYVGRLFIDRVGIIDGLNPQHIADAMKNMFGMTLDYTTSYRALL